MKRRKCAGILFLAVLAVLAAVPQPCAAMVAPKIIPVASLQELLDSYHGEGTELWNYLARTELLCPGEMVLDATTRRVDLVALKGIRVPAGGVLTLDNPNLVVMGMPPVITVESGGRLELLRLHALAAESLPVGGIVIEEGGALVLGETLSLPGGIVDDQNTALPPGLAPGPTPGPEPTAEPDPGPRPEDGPITDFRGDVVQVANGRVMLYLILPPLPMEQTHVTLERSTDRETWTAVCSYAWDREQNYPDCVDDEDCTMRLAGEHVYISHTEAAGTVPFYLRVAVSGPAYPGVSNPALFTLPEGVGPGDTARPPTAHDYDNPGGDRGGGQGKYSRVGQFFQTPAPEPTATPSAAPPPSSAPAAPSESAPAVPAVGVGAPFRSSLGSIGSIAAGGGSRSAQPSPAPAPAPLPKAEAVPSPAPSALMAEEEAAAGPAGIPQETSAPTPETPETPEPMGDGDRGGTALGATLAMCGLAAPALALLPKVHRKGKP